MPHTVPPNPFPAIIAAPLLCLVNATFGLIRFVNTLASASNSPHCCLPIPPPLSTRNLPIISRVQDRQIYVNSRRSHDLGHSSLHLPRICDSGYDPPVEWGIHFQERKGGRYDSFHGV